MKSLRGEFKAISAAWTSRNDKGARTVEDGFVVVDSGSAVDLARRKEGMLHLLGAEKNALLNIRYTS